MKTLQGQKLKVALALLLFFSFVSFGNAQSLITSSGKNTFRSSILGKEYDVEHRGKIEVTDDDKDIKSISSGGYIEITTSAFGSRRYVLIESESGNKLYREYREGRNKVDWEPDGREFLAEILPDLVRNTTIAAESRVNRFYSKGRVPAVLNEIGRIKSDYVKSKYFTLLLRKSGLSSSDLASIADAAGNEVSSDYYLSEILKNNSDQFFKSDQALAAYLRASGKINSDHYLSTVLKKALDQESLNQSQLDLLLQASSKINSDHYLTTVLTEALRGQSMNSQMIQSIIKQSNTIGSDHYQSELIKSALDLNNISPEVLSTIVEAITDVSSDHYMNTILNKILDEDNLDEKVTLEIARKVTRHMTSDHYASEILKKLSRSKLSNEGFEYLLTGIEELQSDHYATTVIKSFDAPSLSDAQMIKLLKAIKSISSDHYATESLTALAGEVNSRSTAVKDTYRIVADNISSETYYGRAMKALRN